MGNPALATDARFQTVEARRAHRDEVNQLVADWVRDRDGSQKKGVPVDAGVAVSVAAVEARVQV